MPNEPHVVAGARLRSINQRYTPGRRALVEILAGSRKPLTIPQILRSRRRLAQSSVYRNLAVLEQAGMVRRVVTTEEFARFELAEDLTEHHHHLICSSCGAVADFTASTRLEGTMQRAMAEASRGTGFAAQGHRLDLIGLCERCAQA